MTICGTGGWVGPLPGDPDNNSLLTATPAFGGIDVSWTYPTVNPHAVAHTTIYRGITANFAASVYLTTASGNFFYDKTTGLVDTLYYYWIRIVSVNGTIGDLIGPASATARPKIAQMIELLSDQIESSELGTTLRTSLGDITLNAAAIAAEVNNRSLGDAAISATLLTVQDDVTGNMALFMEEVALRVEGEDVLAAAISGVAALNSDNAAAILNEQSARVTETAAMTFDITKSFSAVGVNGAAVLGSDSTKIGYSAHGDTPYDGDGVTIVYPIATYPTIDYPYYHLDRKRIIDKLGVDLWNAMPANAGYQLVWYAGLPLAAAVKSIGISDGDGYLTLEQRATAQKLVNGDLYGQWSVKIDTGGRVAGFGLSNTSPIEGPGTSRFIVNADTFSVSKPLDFSQPTAPNATVIGQTWFNTTNNLSYIATATGTANWVVDTPISPFIIDTTTGETYISAAVIKRLTFSTLRNEAGTIMGTEDGKLKAEFIEASAVNVTDALGNIVLASGNGTFSGDLVVGTSPAISGTTMTGSGGNIQSDGPFALGNATTNITFNGTVLTLNGNVVGTSNIVNESVTAPRIAEGSVASNNGGETAVATTTAVDSATGQTVLIINTGVIESTYNVGDTPYATITTLRLKKNGVLMFTIPKGFSMYSDTSGGSNVYSITTMTDNTAGSTASASIFALGCKK